MTNQENVTPVNVGVVGCGKISDVYFENAQRFDAVRVVHCADLDPERARAAAARHGIPRAGRPDDLLADPAVELVLNLTVPLAHAAVGHAALAAGKALYSEKPLATDRAAAAGLLAAARERGLRVGCAPDTSLGGGLQTGRALIDAGAIGQPVAAVALFLAHGPEDWHPNPDFLYQPGAGPLLDIGPYYLTALVTLLGPVRRVTGSARASFPERLPVAGPAGGRRIPVAVPTHVAAVLDFAAGPIATLVTSFDVWSDQSARLEIHGADGSLALPDPNTFGGPVRLLPARQEMWQDVPLTHGHTGNARGLGLADLAQAIRADRPHRASAELAYHVLDVMDAIIEANDTGRHVDIASSCDRPAPLPTDYAP